MSWSTRRWQLLRPTRRQSACSVGLPVVCRSSKVITARAIDWLERSVTIRGNFWYTRAWLIAAYALSNQIDAARQGLIEFRDLFPQLNSIATVINAERNIPHSHPLLIDARKKVHDGLMLAGMPAGAAS